MALLDHEISFVSTFWLASQTALGRTAAWEALQRVKPEHIDDDELRTTFACIAQRFAAGQDLSDASVAVALGWEKEKAADLLGEATSPQFLPELTGNVVNAANLRTRRELVEQAAEYLRGPAIRDHGKPLTDKLALKLWELDAAHESGGTYTTEEIVKRGKERTTKDEDGVAFPWEALNRAAGPLIAGEVCGIMGYSGNGKTQLIANLFRCWGRWKVPMIVYPTEMRLQWFDRVVAAEANVEQWRAEKRQWHGAEEQRRHFVETYDRLLEWEFVMPRAANFSPAEIAVGARVLRRKWGSRVVVVIIDHMHRLRYEEDANKEAGKATMLLKEVAMNEGLIFVNLYQPRKPPEVGTVYGPPDPHMIRGDSTAWTELDVLLAPYRQWVKTSEMGLTPWGTPQSYLDERGAIKLAKKPHEPGSKLDDEHAYVKVGKRRVGGEGPTLALDYWQPSGRIYDGAQEVLWTGADGLPEAGQPDLDADSAASSGLRQLLEEAGWGPEDVVS